jgi:hypothetical protein
MFPLIPNTVPPERQAFLAGFRQSRRGNLYRPLEDGVAVVFKYRNGSKAGSYGWLVAHEEDGETLFSPQGYTRRCDALEALADHLGY